MGKMAGLFKQLVCIGHWLMPMRILGKLGHYPEIEIEVQAVLLGVDFFTDRFANPLSRIARPRLTEGFIRQHDPERD
jgi:hypothetical protein